MSKLDIFVVTHKEKCYRKLLEYYNIIKVGNNKNDFWKKCLSDDNGDNISKKNPNYCELTALYWIWKNYELKDYVGICHYRRFFVKLPFFHLLDEKRVINIMNDYDIILPKTVFMREGNWNHFVNSISGREKDMKNLQLLIKNKYPDYYEAFNDVVFSKNISYYNMFVMKKKDFCDYCEWLFNVLGNFEKYVDLTGYSAQESRIYGFMSEFLINVWVKKNKLKVKYESVLLYDDNFFINLKRRIKIYLNFYKRY